MVFEDRLRHKMALGLPGELVHLEVSPMGRIKSSDAIKKARDIKESAVAIILIEKKQHWHCVLTERQSYKGHHSGQICFPGGKKNQEDADLIVTALRECQEEIGVAEKDLEFIGPLTPVYIPVSNHYVHPYVFISPKKELLFELDPYEVKEVFDFPLTALCASNSLKVSEVMLPDGKTLQDVPHFFLNNKKVWGATALMLNELRYLISE